MQLPKTDLEPNVSLRTKNFLIQQRLHPSVIRTLTAFVNSVYMPADNCNKFIRREKIENS